MYSVHVGFCLHVNEILKYNTKFCQLNAHTAGIQQEDIHTVCVHYTNKPSIFPCVILSQRDYALISAHAAPKCSHLLIMCQDLLIKLQLLIYLYIHKGLFADLSFSFLTLLMCHQWQALNWFFNRVEPIIHSN